MVIMILKSCYDEGGGQAATRRESSVACTWAAVVVPSCLCFTQIPHGLVHWLPVPEVHIEYDIFSLLILAGAG
jgi:hypothetical protein